MLLWLTACRCLPLSVSLPACLPVRLTPCPCLSVSLPPRTLSDRISQFAVVTLDSCAYAGTGNVLKVGGWAGAGLGAEWAGVRGEMSTNKIVSEGARCTGSAGVGQPATGQYASVVLRGACQTRPRYCPLDGACTHVHAADRVSCPPPASRPPPPRPADPRSAGHVRRAHHRRGGGHTPGGWGLSVACACVGLWLGLEQLENSLRSPARMCRVWTTRLGSCSTG